MSLVIVQPSHKVTAIAAEPVPYNGLDAAQQLLQHHYRAVEELSEEQKQQFRQHAAASFSASTRRNYASDHKCFVAFLKKAYPNKARLIDPTSGQWDERHATWSDAIAWVQQMVLAKKKLSTINRRWSYLRAHLIPALSAKEIHEQYHQILAGIRKQLDDGQVKGKRPLLMKHVHAIIALLPKLGNDMMQRRTLLLFGFHSAMRRSELRAMRWDDVEFKSAGIVVRIPVSKTGVGQTITLNRRQGKLCPVRQLEVWHELINPEAKSPVFRTIGKEHDLISEKCISIKCMVKYIKEGCASINLPEHDYAMHSLRSGMISTAADTHSIPQIMQVSRHRNVSSVQSYLKGSLEAFSHGL